MAPEQAARRLAAAALAVIGLCGAPVAAFAGDSVIDLSGRWRFIADPGDSGIAHSWFTRRFGDTVTLPGSMAVNGKGDEVTVATPWTGGIVDSSWFNAPRFVRYRRPGHIRLPFWLTPSRVYAGPAWYQRDVDVPRSWGGKRIVLFLERCHWESRVWVDSNAAGTRNSLGAPHVYDISALLVPGRHTVTVRVDNRIRDVDVGRNAHSVSDHTQTNWNGIIGRLELRAGSPVFIESCSLFPDARTRVFTVLVRLRNGTGRPQEGTLSFRLSRDGDAGGETVTLRRTVSADTLAVMRWWPLGAEARLWDEFHPSLYHLHAAWRGDDTAFADETDVCAGLRDVRTEGKAITVNGRPVFLRGTLDCAVFPGTGYPPMRVGEWESLLGTVRAWGMNHVRFHSWCPPEAAFVAADRLGLYLQVECGTWCRLGDGKPIDRWLEDESERVVAAYGNHPSFCMMAAGNEPSGAAMSPYLSRFVRYWKSKDSRRLYTAAAGWPQVPESDYLSSMQPRIQVWGMGLGSVINARPPSTMFDFRDTTDRYDRPIVAHETGQWCAFPSLADIPQYTGVLRNGAYEIVNDDLAAKGMASLAPSFLRASGALQVLCYKADIEAAMRTPGLAGFQLLGLMDFPGQGTAPVGLLNALAGEKGYVSPAKFNEFCSATVPLARIPKLVLVTEEEFTASLEVAHYGEDTLRECVPGWTVTDGAGRVVARGECPSHGISPGRNTSLGDVHIPLARLHAPGEFRFTLRVGTARNSWNFWVYPSRLPEARGRHPLLVTRTLDEKAESVLRSGGRVLLTLGGEAGAGRQAREIALGFSPIFWNTAWTRGQAPRTLGLLCDSAHPAFGAFPTSIHTDYQWWDPLTHATPIQVDSLGSLSPIIRVIDDWNT
ncbi:MAG TPA: beta-galactosidase, partial [Bacteroidota bacterium]|nr:beta-galactosidase [Bacteroidota bacterium]